VIQPSYFGSPLDRDPVVPDGVEPIVAWRYWRVDDKTGRLRSLARDRTEWLPNVPFTARCRYERLDHTDARWRLVDGSLWKPHESPGEECRCGIYGARDLRALRSHPLFGFRFTVAGEVLLWGKVIRGELGYRAQYAYPRRLFVVLRSRERRAKAVESLSIYGVPVEGMHYEDFSFSPTIAVVDVLKRVAAKLTA
jgi:hypothetical protein